MNPRPSALSSVNKLAVTIGFALIFYSNSFLASDQEVRQTIEGWSAGYPAYISDSALNNLNMLKVIYEEREFAPIWMNPASNGIATVNNQFYDLLTAVSSISNEGLLPNDYKLEFLQSIEASGGSIISDILITDVFLNLSQHLYSGKINPSTLTPEWQAKTKTYPLDQVITLLNEAGVSASLNSVRPTMAEYYLLIEALEVMRELPQIEWHTLSANGLIKVGNADPRLPDIAERLYALGYLPEAPSKMLKDPLIYSLELANAMKVFQRNHGLDSDGVIGKNTFNMLNFSLKQRIDAIIVNLERYRWLDHNMGNTYIVVNIANFDLKVFSQGSLAMQMPVIVGRDFRKTPVFSDMISYLVFNPTWTVPQTIAVQDKLPEIKKDLSYLSKYGFTLHPFDSNIEISPSDVDWNAINKRFPFRLVQQPGPLNAMGQVKFMFPNIYDVYLHDTPARDLFTKNQRAFSSGCIRVSRPLDLAAFLLGSQGIDTNDIQDILDSRIIRTIRLKQKMPVHLEYLTAWVELDQGLQFRSDIYERDKPVLTALSIPAH